MKRNFIIFLYRCEWAKREARTIMYKRLYGVQRTSIARRHCSMYCNCNDLQSFKAYQSCIVDLRQRPLPNADERRGSHAVAFSSSWYVSVHFKCAYFVVEREQRCVKKANYHFTHNIHTQTHSHNVTVVWFGKNSHDDWNRLVSCLSALLAGRHKINTSTSESAPAAGTQHTRFTGPDKANMKKLIICPRMPCECTLRYSAFQWKRERSEE